MIQSPLEGTLEALNAPDLKKLSDDTRTELLDVIWFKKPGDSVTPYVTNNADFMGYVLARAKSYGALSQGLSAACHKISQGLSIL